jgi:transposase
MSRAYIAGIGRHLPNAAITFDRFHVIQLANATLEEVRRAEVRAEPALKRSRWMWLKDKKKWTKKLSTTQISEIPCIFLKLCRLDIMRPGYGSVTKV